jgi:flagellar hook-associated protein 3 FlgL
MIRVTTNGVLNGYRSNLTTSASALNSARNTVLTQRNFNSFSEDPAGATQAFQLRRAWHRTSAQYTVSQSTIRKFNSAWQTLDSVESMIDTDASNSALTAALSGANDPTGSGRNALGSELTQLADSIVQTMNSKYGDNFVFSGADGMTVPFTWDGDTLLYRGVNVSASPNATATLTLDNDTTYSTAAALGNTQIGGSKISDLFTATKDGIEIDLTDANTALAAGDQIVLTAKDSGTMDEAQWTELTKNLADVTVSDADDGSDYEKLTKLAAEGNFVDIGLGLQEDDDGKLIESSAFNDALQGINFLGYGTDEDGDPKNIVCLIKQMGELLSNCDQNGNWANSDDANTFDRLISKFQTASSELKSAYVQLDTKASFLENNNSQLETTADTLNEQFLEIEQCDLADAITSFSWAQYCYNAALKVGNSILSQSLMDYLN